jgi:hypothetical protein
MRGIWFVRTAAVLLALFIAGFVSLPSFPGIGVLTSGFPISVNRALKGDRLPPVALAGKPRGLSLPMVPSQSRRKIPVGCDSAFSPAASPLLADVFKRCTA